MMVVSSPKPSKDSHECAINQWRANASWKQSFDRIIYVGEEEENLHGLWFKSEQFPTIRQLLSFCAGHPGWSAIVNADIVVPVHFRKVEAMLIVNKAQAAVSRRWQFEGENLRNVAIVDLGLDFFAATQNIWRQVLNEFHPSLRIAHNTWDSQMLGILNAKAQGAFWDISPCRCVFHPKHGDRKRQYEIDSQLPGYKPIFPINKLNLFYEQHDPAPING